MIILGVESTAHTFGIGIVKKKKKVKILANEKNAFKPEKGKGIDPFLCAKHHESVKKQVLEKAISKARISMEEIDSIAYSAGPGLPPSLLIGMNFSKQLAEDYKKQLIPVNHCIAHIEIAKFAGKLKDPLILYVSGGNTQIIGYSGKRYRIFGETMDIGIGNALDVLAREFELDFPGGPKIGELWKKGKKRGNYMNLPYVVKGMDLSFSGILSAAKRLYSKSSKTLNIKEDLAFSFQETAFAMLTEITERALSHTLKKELVLTGGVAASERLRKMLSIICRARNVKFYPCLAEYAGDCGANIAFASLLSKNYINQNKAMINPNWRTDEVDISWIK